MGALVRVNGVLKRVNEGWSGRMGVLKRVNGGQGQWGHWSGSMGVLKRVNGGIGQVLKRVNLGVGQGQWGRCQGQWGIEKGQWAIEQGGLNGGIERINGVRVGIEKGQWGRWSGSMGAWRRVRSDKGLALGRTGVWLWVRQGCGPDRRLSYRVVSSTLQGSKLYLAGLQALPYRVASSTL